MPILPVILWTDLLLFALIAAAIGAGLYVRRQPHLRAGWRQVMGNGPAMASATVLAVFVVIGVLDSLHFRAPLEAVKGKAPRYAVEVQSIFDVLVGGLRQRTEKTYSAPLDAYLFAKESVERPDGTQSREFPRLKHGGAHLADPAREADADITRRVLSGLALATVLWLSLGAIIAAAQGHAHGVAAGETWRAIWRGETPVAWRAVMVTGALLLVIAGPVAMLSGGWHVLGTDKVGQDVLYLTLKSIRTALVIGTLTTLVTLPIAVSLGLLAGYLGGWVDDVIQYVYTTLNSIPGVLLIAASVLMMQVVIDTHPDWFATSAERADARLLALCLILGMTSWTGLCRLLRGETLKLRELDYVQAARAFGVSKLRIMARHILPNLMHIVLISVVMDFSGLVLAEAVLSYVGVGVDPSTISFGTMINTARMELSREPMVWWSLLAAFVFMFLLVLAANLFADAVRDAFDPRMRRIVRPRTVWPAARGVARGAA
ncbi:MAG TPA: ABC transporter permease [Rhodocyclaceae bacterium]|nr:ABC transporter permease [Rhodocyclaceae bacterium]HMV52659.1 ABC transporter permease [Rhodocyclaceae bacterium]HMZ83525.1 ABC transporter permease [Rhodocyclaceae bacterium]HNA03669.1 ABC transporter permease [Rhodocyclaceae bacterium]HNB78935.1 ABC transporter permease [Rhodocyclaceae bacterium]